MLFKSNKVVVENYFFMTVLQVLNTLFYVLIYPYLIRTLGAESYGLYVFAMSIVTYFVSFVGFGFDLPAVKIIAQYPTDEKLKAHTLSCIYTAKIYLEILSLIVFSIIIFSVPYLRNNWALLFICFSQTLTNIIFPQWYFQGLQKMRIVTYVQLGLKLISLPFIFLTIHTSNDINAFALIASITSIAGGFGAAVIIRFYDRIRIQLMPFGAVKKWFAEATPFFLSSSASLIKEQSVAILIGVFFGMKDVAIYDLANKIVAVPRLLLTSINGALFPNIVSKFSTALIKKILRYQVYLCLFIIGLIALFGKWVLLLMGGVSLVGSYPLAIILSVTILPWLIVSSFIYFIFVPNNNYYFVTKNQVVALISFVVYAAIGLLFVDNISVLAAALSLSGLTEIVFCSYLIRKNALLS
ncbi:MAG: oligosaccharide flippase family protein [Paludibacter sp.]|nr:oligosaccharide flippase family protein [Paludibacter sp.]